MFGYDTLDFSPDEILIYLRKSRADDPLMSVEEILEKHEKILDEWCLKNLGALVPECNRFREIVSGETIKSRPEFQNVLRLIEMPRYKGVLIVDCSRLGRPDTETIGRITNLFRYSNTLIITTDFIFDVCDEFGRERLKMELERSYWYLEAYKKINIRGRENSVKNGWYIGSIAPYGYDKVFVLDGKKKRPTLAINESEAEAVKVAFDLYVNHDMGMTNIAHKLDELGFKTRKGVMFSTATIKDMLDNEHYAGKVFWNCRKTITSVENGEIVAKRPKAKEYDVFEGKHPAIVSEEMFERARAKKGKNTRQKAKTKVRNPLAGLVYCQCGRAMSYRTYKDKNGRERNEPRLLCDNQAFCHTQSAKYAEILNKVIEILKNCIADFEVQIKNNPNDTLSNHEKHIKRLEAKYEELAKKELAQWEKYTEENMPKSVFDKLNEKVLQEKETVLQALDNLRANVPTVEKFQEKAMLFTDALNALEDPNVSAELKNRLLKACIKRIDYNREGRGSRWSETPFELNVTLNV